MVGKKRKDTCASTTKKTTGPKLSTEGTTKLSLPVISDEKISFEQNLSRCMSNKTDENIPKIVIPKIKIKCKPLNIEKIIDFENNNVIIKKIGDTKRALRTYSGPKATRSKATRTKKPENEVAKVATEIKSLRSYKRAVVKQSSSETSPDLSLNISNKSVHGNKRKRNAVEVPLSEKGSLFQTCSPTKEAIITEQNLQPSTFENLQDISSSSLKTEDQRTQGHQTFFYLDDESALMELSGVNLYELVPCLENLTDEDINMKECEILETLECENNSPDSNNLHFHDRGKNPPDNCAINQCAINVVKTSLQTAVENFLKNPQVKYVTGKTTLEKGLCFSWLSNGNCSNEHCTYSHNVLNLFIKKLKRFPTKFIMTEVVAMRNDALFVDVVMAAFKVISERKIPVVWVTFLTFFVFYVTEPSDSRFLKFWANAARFFCELKENYSTARGFASLLSIFSQGESSEEWKIIEFIKLIKQPPVQVRINFALLQPVLKLNLPSEFLIEAVESCITTQKDVLQVYCFIVPKISINTSPIQVVELLLKLCKVLEVMNRKSFVDDLKHRLRGKVLSFKTKISDREHPLTAVFQESFIDGNNTENFPAASDMSKESDLIRLEVENNYFLPEGDFCNLLTQAMEHSPETIPSPFRKTEDVGERQVSRIKQFFRDCRFDLLGKYLNDLKPSVTELAAKELLKLLFQMKISLQQGVDLVKIMLLPCKTEIAAKIIASISITLTLNLVRINEWKKAYEIVSMCKKKEINLVEGKLFYCLGMNTVTQCRIVLLLIEIHSYKGSYADAVALVKKYSLFSSNKTSWQLNWKTQDETTRIRILEDLLEQFISDQATEETYDLFQLIWKDQNQLLDPVDLKKFINEVLILLLNQENEEAIKLYEQVKANVRLNDTTYRAILVSLVRRNLLSAAKRLVFSDKQNAYFLPEITSTSASLKVYSFWLEEEIYIMLSTFFDLLISKTTNFDFENYSDVELILHESKSNLAVGLRPLCLGIINPSFKDASTRIQRVLQHQFNPPVKLIIMPYSLKLDESSLKSHLEKRINEVTDN